MKRALYRELGRISRYKRHFVAAVVIPLLSLLFMATIFGGGKIENLPFGVVDLSGTPNSREIIRSVGASPVLDIKEKNIFSNEAQAKKALQRMEIYGYITIPENFSKELHNGNTPTVTCTLHYALLAIGGEIQKACVKTLGGVSASFVTEYGNYAGITESQNEAIILPSNGIFTSTYNTGLNYGVFLSYPFFFIFFQIFILVFTVYTIGTDLNKERLLSGKGNILYALTGKLFPYALLFISQTLIANRVFIGIGAIPAEGNLFVLNASSLLFILSSMALGIIIISIIPKISIAISAASMIGALGATLSGVTFPIENMYPAVRVISNLFPIRHFILANQAFVYNGAGIAYSWGSYVALLGTIAVSICTTPLLKRAILGKKGQPIPAIYTATFIMLGGTLGYGFLYSLLYLPNIVTDVPVAAVDLSRSPLSREYLRNLDATQGVNIQNCCSNMKEAVRLMESAQVKGIIVIPDNFASLAAQGEEATFAVYETTSSFLYYLTIQKSVAATMQELNNTLRSGAVSSLTTLQQLEMARTPSFTTRIVAIYNSKGGYGSYLLPIAFIVIFFQTMLMCGGILAGSRTISPFRFLPLLGGGYFLLSFFLTGIVPRIFGLPALASPLQLGILMLLMTAASATFIGIVTLPLKEPEEVMLYVPTFSVALIFLSGTSYPFIQLPHFWQIIHYLLPTSPGIVGYIKLNSMGGTLADIAPQLCILLIQTIIYGAIFLLCTRKIVHLHQRNQ